ncbi:MAG: hypothetical protein ABC588_08960 [Candidatus Methanosuratincola petrocarbonis]
MFEEIFRGFLRAQAFSLGEIRLRLISTNPSGIVKIKATEIELLPQRLRSQFHNSKGKCLLLEMLWGARRVSHRC